MLCWSLLIGGSDWELLGGAQASHGSAGGKTPRPPEAVLLIPINTH